MILGPDQYGLKRSRMIKDWLGRVFSFLSLIVLTNWLICTSNLFMDWVKAFWDWITASILFFKSFGFSFYCGGTWKGENEAWFWKFCGNCESTVFCICCWDSNKASKLFFNSNFSSIDCSWKDIKHNLEKIVEKVFENLARGRHIPTDSMNS